MTLTQTTGPTLGGQKPKGRNNSNLKPGKGDFKHSNLKKERKKRQSNTTQMMEQTRRQESE